MTQFKNVLKLPGGDEEEKSPGAVSFCSKNFFGQRKRGPTDLYGSALTLLSRGIFVFPPLTIMKKETSSSSCSSFVSIRQHPSKSVNGKILRSFAVRWRQLARARQKNKHDLVSFFLLVREGNSKKLLPSRVLCSGLCSKKLYTSSFSKFFLKHAKIWVMMTVTEIKTSSHFPPSLYRREIR